MPYVCPICIQDQSFNNFKNDTMKQSVNETKLTGLGSSIQRIFI